MAAQGDYAGKPRPAVVIQDDAFAGLASITVCGFTTDDINVFPTRPSVEPDALNGLASRSWLMVDKVLTVPREKVGKRVGELTPADLARLDQALLLFLGLAARSSE